MYKIEIITNVSIGHLTLFNESCKQSIGANYKKSSQGSKASRRKYYKIAPKEVYCNNVK